MLLDLAFSAPPFYKEINGYMRYLRKYGDFNWHYMYSIHSAMANSFYNSSASPAKSNN